jgi:asparagine synthase (glutamine-hydrolysing)
VKNSDQRAVLKKELFKDEKLCADLDKYALVPLYLDNVNETIINTHFQAPHLTNRFETHALMADSMGFEIQWPLWDVDLIQNFLSTPNIEKMGPKMQRRFLHRRAVADVVPDHIRNINSKFTGEPLKTISQSDEERKTYNDMAIEFKKSLHPDIQALVDMPKLEKMRMRALDFIGKQYSHEEYPFELCTLQLYALDYWYKTGEA